MDDVNKTFYVSIVVRVTCLVVYVTSCIFILVTKLSALSDSSNVIDWSVYSFCSFFGTVSVIFVGNIVANKKRSLFL